MKFKRGAWTNELVEEWLPLWAMLWNEHGVEWEWQIHDEFFIEKRRALGVLYAHHIVDVWSKNNPIPLPPWPVVQDMAELIYSKDNQDFYYELYDFSYKLVPPDVSE
jgi:hypothetical protein